MRDTRERAIREQAFLGHEGIEKFCGCYRGHIRALPHAPAPLQIHREVVHHTCKHAATCQLNSTHSMWICST